MSNSDHQDSRIADRNFHLLLCAADEIYLKNRLADDLLAGGFLANLKQSGGYKAVSIIRSQLIFDLGDNRTVGIKSVIEGNLAALPRRPAIIGSQKSRNPCLTDLWGRSFPFEGTLRHTLLLMRDMVAHPSDKLRNLAKCNVNIDEFAAHSSGDLALIDLILPGFTVALVRSVKGGSLWTKYPRFNGFYLQDVSQ